MSSRDVVAGVLVALAVVAWVVGGVAEVLLSTRTTVLVVGALRGLVEGGGGHGTRRLTRSTTTSSGTWRKSA